MNAVRKTMTTGEDLFESKIGSGTLVSGTLKFQGLARIEGVAAGEITGEDVEIAEGAVVKARVSAVRVTVGGKPGW